MIQSGAGMHARARPYMYKTNFKSLFPYLVMRSIWKNMHTAKLADETNKRKILLAACIFARMQTN